MKRFLFSATVVFSFFISFGLLAQETTIQLKIEGKLSGKDFVYTSFNEQGYQNSESLEGELSAELTRPAQIEFLHLKGNGKILGRKTFWVGDGTYIITGSINDIINLTIDIEHPYAKLSNEISQAEPELQEQLILQNLDKEVGLNWLISKSSEFSQEELQSSILSVSPELQELNSYKRFVAEVNLEGVSFSRKEGNPSRDFELESRSGKRVSLSEFDGQYRLLEFSFSGCKPCIEALPEIGEIHKQFGDELEIISIWNDPTKETWLNSSKKYKEMILWTDLWDESGYVTKLYQIDLWPTYMLVNPKGEIEQIWRGYIKGRMLRKMENVLSD